MIALGLILLLVGLIFGVGLLFWLGVILLIVGALFFVLGSSGRPVGGRRYWY